MVQGCYHSIETFGTVDGQGIRYVLFLSGCQLSCKFCHNPDTWAFSSKKISVDEVLADMNKYRDFYDTSGGGITVSGGEPLLQPEFLASLFKLCREQAIHTTVDTSGYCPPEHFRQVLPYTDAVLFSLKTVNPIKHRWLTGHDNNTILSNLCYVSGHSHLTIRYVVIPGINNGREDIMALAELIHSLPTLPPVELLAYHTLGREKWAKLGRDYPLDGVPDATENDVQAVRNWLTEKGVTVLY